jgi:hypothetical protein
MAIQVLQPSLLQKSVSHMPIKACFIVVMNSAFAFKFFPMGVVGIQLLFSDLDAPGPFVQRPDKPPQSSSSPGAMHQDETL